MNKNNLKLKAEAVLDKVKSLSNIKSALKIIETKLSKIRIQGTLNITQPKKELNTKLKSLKPKIKVDADTRQATEKVKKLSQQNAKPTIKPTIDDSQAMADLKTTQEKTKSLFAKFKDSTIGSQLIRMSVQQVTQAIHEAISTVKELDSIKTGIQSTSGVSDIEADAMMHSYNQTAQNLGSTTKDIGNAANEILRMGVSVSDTNRLIETSTILAKTGMIDSSQAAEYLISTLKGYQLSAGESMKIADKLTGVDKEAAVSAGGLAEAISKCAETANNSGTSLERLIGYAAAIGETTQDSMSTVGNSLKSVYDRMNNIKTGKLTDDENGESLANAELHLNKLGIQLRDTSNNYKDFDAVLDDINAQWKNMTQTEQQELAAAVAGNAQKEHFTALMNNYADALKYSETAAGSAGSALERYGIYQNSLDAKVNVLTASLEALFTDTMSEDLYGGIVQATTGIVKFLDSTQALKGTFAGLAALGITKMFVSMGAGMITAYKSTAQLTNAMGLLSNGKSKQNLIAIGDACKELSDKQFKLVLSAKGLQHQDRLTILSGKGVEEEMQEETLATLGFSNAQDKAATSSFSLRGAFNALKTAIATNPMGLLITAVSSVTMAFSYFKQKQEDATQSLKNTLSTYESAKSELENINSELEQNRQKISDLEAKSKLTYTEKGQLDELKQITEQLELQKEISEWQLKGRQKEVATESMDYINSKYNLGNSNIRDVDALIPTMLSGDYRSLDASGNIDTDAEYLAAAYKTASTELTNLIQKRKEMPNSTPDAVLMDNDIEANKVSVESVKSEINDMLASLMEQKANMQDYYNSIKDTPYEDMSTDAKNCYDTMQQIDASMQTLYYGLGNNRFNNEIIDNLFNTDGIEVTKEHLIKMAQAGTLNPATIASYENLADALLNSNYIADEGCGLFETLCNEIYALADAEEKTADSSVNMSKAFSKSAMIDSINALSDGFDAIDKIYSDVKDGSTFDFSLLDSKNFKETFSGLDAEYNAFIEKVASSPGDIEGCQDAFNSLISKWIESKGVLENLTEENAQVTASMLENMGVANAQELVDGALIRKKYQLLTASKEYIEASAETKQAMFDECFAGEALEQAVNQISLQRQIANANALDTSTDVDAIFSLAQAAGFSAESLYHLAEARDFLMEAEASGDADQINEAKEGIRRIVA